MNPRSLSCVGLVISALAALLYIPQTSSEYPGVIELVGYSNRRARTHYVPQPDSSFQPKTKIQADIETVKQNIEKYNKLLTVDTRNLPESQKDMLERIVERVARLKESLTIDDETPVGNSTQRRLHDGELLSSSPTTTSAVSIESETDPALILDETTSLLQHQPTTMDDDLTAAYKMPQWPTTTELVPEEAADYSAIDTVDATDDASASVGVSTTSEVENSSEENPTSSSSEEEETMTVTATDDQIVARSNNNMATISAAVVGGGGGSSGSSAGSSNHRTLVSKTKNRQSPTKKPTTLSLSAKTSSSSASASASPSASSTLTTKRVNNHNSKTNGQRPSSSSSSSALKQTTVPSSSSGLPSSSSSMKQKIVSATITTMQPQQHQQQLKQKQHLKEQENLMKLHQVQQQQQKPPKSSQQQNYHDQDHVTATATAAATIAEQKTVTIPTTVSSSEQILREQQQQQIQQRTPLGGGGFALSAGISGSGSNDMLYDSNVNTSAIIDSLNHAREEFYNQKQATVHLKDKKPSATAKPTKYHYYPHNQHIYLLPECAIQQVCNAVYVRLNYTQPLCACPSRYRDPCSASLNEDDQHTTKLVGDGKKKAITLAKTCEATTEMRECRSPKDWSLLALQNTRTGKSHYLVICRCPDHFKMEGPMAHDQPTYASVPGIRVFGMMCVKPGYSVRKPSGQPPKRYQLQKPYYIPNSQNRYSNSANSRPSAFSSSPTSSSSSSSSSSMFNKGGYQQHQQMDTFQSQHQANYQYLNRPDSSHIGQHNADNYPESISINSFSGGIYGRNNERKGEKPIVAVSEDEQRIIMTGSSTMTPEDTRTTIISGNSVTSDASATVQQESAAVSESKREKRSIVTEIEDNSPMPEFPWYRVLEFQQSIVWD